MTTIGLDSTMRAAADPLSAAGGDRRGRASLDPLRKAAILVVSLEETLARQILSLLDRADVDAVSLEMARLEHIDPALQRDVLAEFHALGMRRLRFVFDDVVRMDDGDLSLAFHEDEAGAWALALAGASRPARQKVLGALAPPSAEALRQALAGLGPFRLEDVETAQAEIAERLRRLHDEGLLALPEPDGQEEILV
jgi:flagellar motor switch protein FliG